jgi:hypothetical protein
MMTRQQIEDWRQHLYNEYLQSKQAIEEAETRIKAHRQEHGYSAAADQVCATIEQEIGNHKQAARDLWVSIETLKIVLETEPQPSSDTEEQPRRRGRPKKPVTD